MQNRDLAKRLSEGIGADPPPLEDEPPPEERWWEDSDVDPDELLRGLAKYALARDSRYDELRKDTTRIAASLQTAVRELRTFRAEAATRAEVFSRTQIRRTALFALFGVLVALALSTVFTLGVVLPKCFFGAIPHSQACHVIPGYTDSEKAQLQRITDLQRGVGAVPENRARIEDLERRVGQLEQEPR